MKTNTLDEAKLREILHVEHPCDEHETMDYCHVEPDITAIQSLAAEAVVAELEMWQAAQEAGATHRSSLAQRIALLKQKESQ